MLRDDLVFVTTAPLFKQKSIFLFFVAVEKNLYYWYLDPLEHFWNYQGAFKLDLETFAVIIRLIISCNGPIDG